MLYVHEENINTKITQVKNSKGKKVNGYNNLKPQLIEFRDNVYYPFRKEIEKHKFDEEHKNDFVIATKKFNEYKKLVDEHIILAKTDSAITEMSALMEKNSDEILADVVYDYWKEVKDAVGSAENTEIQSCGRLIKTHNSF